MVNWIYMSHVDGINAFNEKSYARAVGLFFQAIAENPEQAENYLYLGKCYFFLDQQQFAIPYVEKFIELREKTPDEVANVPYAFDLIAQCYVAMNVYSEALKNYQQAIAIDASCSSAWHNMGLLYMKSANDYLNGKLDVIAYLDCEADLNNDNNLNLNPNLSIILFKKAMHCIKNALNICENNPMLLHSLASWFEQYVEVLEQATAIDELDRQQKILGSFDNAIKYYQIALSTCQEQDAVLKRIILSNFVECLAQLGHFLYKNNNYKKAHETYLQALALDPEHLVVINQIGMSLFNLACFPEARQYFSSIFKKTADHQEIADAWLNIASTHRLEGQWTKAHDALHKARKFAPQDKLIADEEIKLKESIHISAPPPTYNAYIDAINAFNKNNYKMAKDLFLQAIEENSKEPQRYFYLGKCYFFCDEKQLAISSLKRFIELKQLNPYTSDDKADVSYAFDLIGQCYEEEQKDTKALTCYKTATKIYPPMATAWNNMGLIYMASARHYFETELDNSIDFFFEAQTCIQTALKITNNNPVFLQNLASWYELYASRYEKYIEVAKIADEEAVQNIESHFNQAIELYQKALLACHGQSLTLKNITLSNFTKCLVQFGDHLDNNYVQEKLQNVSLMEYKQKMTDAWLSLARTHGAAAEWSKAEGALIEAKKFTPKADIITDEEIKLAEAKSAFFLVSTSQTLFSSSSAHPHSGENNIAEETAFRPG